MADSTLAGTVRAASGPGWGGAFVWLLAVPAGETPSADELRLRGRFASASPTYEFTHVRPGLYRIGAGLAFGRIQVEKTIEVEAGAVRVDLEVPPLADTEFAVVDVEGPDGRRLEDASVSMGFEDLGMTAGSGASIRDADGGWRIPLTGYDASAVGRHVIRVSSREHGELIVPVAAGAARRVRARFDAPALLEVSLDGPAVADGSEEPLGVVLAPEALVEPHAPPRTPLFEVEFLAGRRFLGPVQPGAYVAHLVTAEKRASSELRSVAQERIVLRPGPNTLRILRPSLSVLRIHPPAGASGGWMTLERAAVLPIFRPSDSAAVGASETAEFRRLAPGRYVMAYRRQEGPPEGEMAFELQAGTADLVFRAGGIGGVRVSGAASGGTLHAAGLRDGDVLMTLGGQSFDDSEQLTSLVRAVARQATFSVEVERAGTRRRLDVTARIFASEAVAGGRLERVAR